MNILTPHTIFYVTKKQKQTITWVEEMQAICIWTTVYFS